MAELRDFARQRVSSSRTSLWDSSGTACAEQLERRARPGGDCCSAVNSASGPTPQCVRSAQRIESVEGLRAIAFLAVFAFHTWEFAGRPTSGALRSLIVLVLSVPFTGRMFAGKPLSHLGYWSSGIFLIPHLPTAWYVSEFLQKFLDIPEGPLLLLLLWTIGSASCSPSAAPVRYGRAPHAPIGRRVLVATQGASRFNRGPEPSSGYRRVGMPSPTPAARARRGRPRTPRRRRGSHRARHPSPRRRAR